MRVSLIKLNKVLLFCLLLLYFLPKNVAAILCQPTIGQLCQRCRASISKSLKLNAIDATIAKSGFFNGFGCNFADLILSRVTARHCIDENCTNQGLLTSPLRRSEGSNVVEELNQYNTTTESYIEGLGVDQHIAKVINGNVYAYVTDPLGTVRNVVDGSGQIVNDYTYKAYGDSRSKIEAVDNAYLFTGRRFDNDTGSYYYRARYYDPLTGMFGGVDRYAPNQQTYAYAAQNPLMYTDPSGEFCLIDDLAAAAITLLTINAAVNIAHFTALVAITSQSPNVESCASSISFDYFGPIPLDVNYNLETKLKDGRTLSQGLSLWDVLLLTSAAAKAGKCLNSFAGASFKSKKELMRHYLKHKDEFMKVGNLTSYSKAQYLNDARRVIRTGTKVTFTSGKHAGTVNYIRFGGIKKMNVPWAKRRGFVELVGLNSNGKISTYSFKSFRQLEKLGVKLAK